MLIYVVYSGDKIQNEMGGACSTCEGEKMRIKGFGGGRLRERDHLVDQGVDGSSGSGMWRYGLDRAGSG